MATTPPVVNRGGFNSQKDKTREVMAKYNNTDMTPVVQPQPQREYEPKQKPGRKTGRTKTAISVTIDKELIEFLEKKQQQTRLNKSILVEDAIRGFYAHEIY